MKFLLGNLFRLRSFIRVVPVNTRGVLGAGAAKEWRRADDAWAATERYIARCKAGEMQLGRPVLFGRSAYLAFPTKQDPRRPSKLEWIKEGITRINTRYRKDPGVFRLPLAVPLLGAGLGGLSIEAVLTELERLEPAWVLVERNVDRLKKIMKARYDNRTFVHIFGRRSKSGGTTEDFLAAAALAADQVRKDRVLLTGNAEGVDRAALGRFRKAHQPRVIFPVVGFAFYDMADEEDDVLFTSESEPWSVQQAMFRSELAAAIADVNAVISANTSGGTWRTAEYVLKTLGRKLYVRDVDIPGNRALIEMGAIPFRIKA